MENKAEIIAEIKAEIKAQSAEKNSAEGKTKKERLMGAISYYPSDFDQSTISLDYYTHENFCVASFEGTPTNSIPTCFHSHDEYEFIIPKTPIHYMLREEMICFGQVGCVYPIPSMVGHGIKYTQQNVRLDAISINKEYFEQIRQEKHCENIIIQDEFTFTETLRCYINAFKNGCRQQVRDEKNKLEPLSRLITSELIDLLAQAKAPKTHKPSAYQKGIRSAADYINEHYAENLTLEDLAAICGLTTGYFTRCFNKMFLNSPSAYIAMVRISQAKILLENTLLPVKEIALKVGYNRSSTFCDAFKKETGMTPNEYRTSVSTYREDFETDNGRRRRRR